MKILVAPDSFKDALPAIAVCHHIQKGIMEACPEAAVMLCPMADGGEGTVDALAYHLAGTAKKATVHDPLMRPIIASYFHFDETAYIEMAQASGLQLLKPAERNPLITTTFGTGELIMSALRNGTKKIFLAIGGSATNDGGMGMAAALGWRFLAVDGTAIQPIGGNLGKIARVLPPENPVQGWGGISFTLLTDVTNPLYGPNGAAHVFAKQKGATASQVAMLDEGLCHFAKMVKLAMDKDFAALEGAGAAGGLGFGAMAFLGAKQKSGAEAIMELIGFDQKLVWADCVITGEGKLDGQTARGKLIGQIGLKARNFGIPVFGICGKIEATESQLKAIGLSAAVQLQRPEEPLADSIQRTPQALTTAVRSILSSYFPRAAS